MIVFGKPAAEYFSFQKSILILIVVVGLGRLGLSLTGVPNSSVKWVSLTFVSLIGIIYCAVKVPRTGFGGYKTLLPLYFVQSMTGNLIISGSIVLAALTGQTNIYSAPEYSGPMADNPWLHAGGHLLDGLLIGPLLGWLLGSGIMFIVKKTSPAKGTEIPQTSR